MQGGHVEVVLDSTLLEMPDRGNADVAGCGVVIVVIDRGVFGNDALKGVTGNEVQCSVFLFEAAETAHPAYSRLIPLLELGFCETASEKGEGKVGLMKLIIVEGTFEGCGGEVVFTQIAIGEGEVEVKAGEINGFEDVGCGCLEADFFEKGAARG